MANKTADGSGPFFDIFHGSLAYAGPLLLGSFSSNCGLGQVWVSPFMILVISGDPRRRGKRDGND